MAGTVAVTGAAGMDTERTSIAIHRHRPCRHHRLEVGALRAHRAQDPTCLEHDFAVSAANQ